MNRTIEVTCNPSNPVNYLACCGAFDLLARMDASTLGSWKIQAPISFRMESLITETDFVAIILDTLCDAKRWHFVRPTQIGEPFQIQAEFVFQTKSIFVPLDWWFETAEEDGAIREKSAWKMYAGQQTVEKITTDMVENCSKARRSVPAPSVSELLQIAVEMTGRYGFDPRASRTALDVGYSPNDLKMPVETFVFAETLAVFGLSSFFPARLRQPGILASSRGWRGSEEGEGEKGFYYRPWSQPLPVTLARYAAVQRVFKDAPMLFSIRAYRKNYSNLTLAHPI